MYQQNQQALLRLIYEVGFAIDDVVLYLDTHPCDQEAIRYYNEYRDLRRQAVDEYTKCFGPLSDEDVNTESQQWTWIRDPWPWEGVCC